MFGHSRRGDRRVPVFAAGMRRRVPLADTTGPGAAGGTAGDSHAHGYRHPDPNGHADAYPNAHAHTHPHAHASAHEHARAHAHPRAARRDRLGQGTDTVPGRSLWQPHGVSAPGLRRPVDVLQDGQDGRERAMVHQQRDARHILRLGCRQAVRHDQLPIKDGHSRPRHGLWRPRSRGLQIAPGRTTPPHSKGQQMTCWPFLRPVRLR